MLPTLLGLKARRGVVALGGGRQQDSGCSIRQQCWTSPSAGFDEFVFQGRGEPCPGLSEGYGGISWAI